MTRGLAPLRHRGFRFLAAGQFASNVGDAFFAVALPWYVLAAHGGPLLLGTVLVAYGVPRTATLAFGGHASDRWGPWTVMMGSDVVRAACLAALAVAALGPARPVILVPIAVVLGAGEGLFLPGSFAIVPALLPDADLQAGNALTSGGTQLATLAGPALGGALVALAGAVPAFALDAGSFVVSAATLAGVRSVQRRARVASAGTAAPASAEAEVAPAEAVAARERGVPAPTLRGLLRSQRVLQIMLLVTVAANLGSGGVDSVAIPSLAHGPLRANAVGYGALIAAFAAGALIGTIAAGAGRPRASARHHRLGRLPGRSAVPRRRPVSRRHRPGRRRAGGHRGNERLRQHRHDHCFPALGAPGSAWPADRPAAAGQLRHLSSLSGTRRCGGT